jgi:hypothetical protein
MYGNIEMNYIVKVYKMGSLLTPCKNMLEHKLQITPPDNIIAEIIENAIKSTPQDITSQDTNAYNKKILAYVYEQFKKTDTIDNAVKQLETIRSLPVNNTNDIPNTPQNIQKNHNTNSVIPVPYINPDLMYNTIPKFNTHLVTLTSSKANIKLPTNTKCYLHCILSNMLKEDILIITLLNHTTKYTFHLYKENNIYKTIDNINPIIISNKNTFQIHIQNYKNNHIEFPQKEVILEQIQQIDKHHFKLITSNEHSSQHDIQINQHTFYYVDTNTYITDSTIADLTQFINSKCIILANNINILFKYT